MVPPKRVSAGLFHIEVRSMATHPTRERRLSRHPASPIVCFGAMSVPGRPCSAARAVTRRGVQEPRRDGFAEGKIHQSARASRGCRIRGDPVSGDPYARATGSARGDTERGRSRVRPGLFGFSNAGRSSDGGPPPGEIAGGIRFRSAFRALNLERGGIRAPTPLSVLVPERTGYDGTTRSLRVPARSH
jgi:hypothetical protein